MNETQNNRTAVRVTEGIPDDTSVVREATPQNKMQKLRKPIIFGLMGLVFIGCMYLIFKPSSDNKETEQLGINEVVPQASEEGLQSDKQKAYEKDILEQKNQEKRNAMMSLSDYWASGEDQNPKVVPSENEPQLLPDNKNRPPVINPAVSSYQNAQNTLGSFYQQDDYEKEKLKKEIRQLKKEADYKANTPVSDPVENQLKLMEKSYAMAAKYLPSGKTDQVSNVETKTASTHKIDQPKVERQFSSVTSSKKNIVSTLYRETGNQEFLENWSEERNRNFLNIDSDSKQTHSSNTIKACIHEGLQLTGQGFVKIRLLESAQITNHIIPKGNILIAEAKFQNNRLQLTVSSVEIDANIIPVELNVYDMDGQQGLSVSYSQEMNALTEMAGNMSQTSGTSLMLTQSAGQQIATDLSRGIMQGISGYFSKKVRTQKVNLKAGHQILLVSKK
jgi:conjugative transposon TraM protein